MSGAPPFSRPQRVDGLPAEGLTRTIEAGAAERAALAALNRLPAIGRLTATFGLRRSGRDGVRVTGAVNAEVTQICVVTLEPFAATIDEPVEVAFAPAAEEGAARRGGEGGDEASFDLAGEDPPDPIAEGGIDLGALAAEFLALGLDPYPRKPGVAFAPPASDGADASPFAALAKLKPKKKR